MRMAALSGLLFAVAAEFAVACEQNPPGWLAARGTGLCAQSERIGLPDTRVSVRIPSGYVCSSESTVFFEDLEAHAINCLPEHGGTPFELQRELGSRVPKSLGNYLAEQIDRAAKNPAEDAIIAPHLVRVAGHRAVESAAKGRAFFDGPSGGSQGELLTHAFEIEDSSGFYTCSMSTTPLQYSAQLRRGLREFCDSIAF